MDFNDPPANAWTAARQTLWQRVEDHDFDPEIPLSFTKRLARERGWSPGFARAAVGEYRKFCFLAVVSTVPVTPSLAVDEVWHLHLIYSRDYWDVWCGAVLQAAFHHDPTQGGPAAQRRYRAQYAQTLAFYETFFGPPGEKIWPATHVRFGGRPRWRLPSWRFA